MPGDDGLRSHLKRTPVIPVVTIEDAGQAVPLARSLVAGGLPTIEITLRTSAAIEAIHAIVAEVREATVAAGTVLNPEQYHRSVRAGAAFIVSPGVTDDLLAAAADHDVPFLPGVATAGEAMRLADRGYRYLKFFPAEAAGGIPYLAALVAPLPQLWFCPTGGITPILAPRYLSLRNVICVGGSWMATRELIAAGEWGQIEQRAVAASSWRRKLLAQ